jgi:Pyridoxamine 5'-phosphate oxidase
MPHAVRHRPAPQGRPGTVTPTFAGKYLSLTSFRRDGTGVATPVWFVEADGRLLVETDAGSCKVRRIRRNPQVTLAPPAPPPAGSAAPRCRPGPSCSPTPRSPTSTG